MSNRFVSGGTISSSGEVSRDDSGHDAVVAAAREPLMKKDAEWEAVRHELEEDRRRREEARTRAVEEGGQQSLYDILQANKAAKQAAFEEQNKLKNQFRALDDDEIEFLDEVRAKEKAEEARAKREVEEGLKAFRERQKSTGGGEASAAAKEDEKGAVEEEEEWVVGGRKRKRHEREVLRVKKKAVGGGKEEVKDEAVAVSKTDGDDGKTKEGAKKEREDERKPPTEAKRTGLGLVAYGSDSDESDED
ncbi:nefa-interacting nuclear nip30 [Trichoderma arundinaceum]|uniref:Nefa-interacting nuclear nip30 n=1 Tax=Trichoderma arundinaceum TaxID=490622 RepID=A0A395NIM0_TRIAR|nr:nefa-interacting nuclear nip30 [Trichoderma arundinaceum]